MQRRWVPASAGTTKDVRAGRIRPGGNGVTALQRSCVMVWVERSEATMQRRWVPASAGTTKDVRAGRIHPGGNVLMIEDMGTEADA